MSVFVTKWKIEVKKRIELARPDLTEPDPDGYPLTLRVDETIRVRIEQIVGKKRYLNDTFIVSDNSHPNSIIYNALTGNSNSSNQRIPSILQPYLNTSSTGVKYIDASALQGTATEKTKLINDIYRDWETDRKSTRLNSSH